MKAIKVLLIVFISFFFITHTSSAEAQSLYQRKIVVFKPGIARAERLRTIQDLKISFLKELPLVNGLVVQIPEAALERLSRSGRILRVEPDIEFQATGICDYFPTFPWCQVSPTPMPTPTPTLTVKPSLTPTPTPSTAGPSPTPIPTLTPIPTPIVGQTFPWGIIKIEADKAWSVSTGSGVRVAVLDTGIDRDHPDLVDNLAGCQNFIRPTRTCEDDNGHGTHVAGIIAASDNGIGVVGVAPKAKIYSLKVLNNRGSGYLSDIIEGLNWAIDNQMQVVSMSLGSSSYSQTFEEAINKVHAAGIIQVVSAGNSGPGSNTVTYPARFPVTIAVAATDINNQVPSWSSRGTQVDIAAPGVDINSTYLNGKYKLMSGTSMAAPHVTGVVALRLFLHPGESPNQMESVIKGTATYLPFDVTWVGAGLINANNAAHY